MKSKIALLVAAAALILAGVAGASKVSRPSVGVAQSKLGRILVDGRGRSLTCSRRTRAARAAATAPAPPTGRP
jgi:hypothetical protein